MTDFKEAELPKEIKCIDLLRQFAWMYCRGRRDYEILQQLDQVFGELIGAFDPPRCREQASGDDGGGSVQAIIDKWGVPLDSSFIPMLHEAFRAGRSQTIDDLNEVAWGIIANAGGGDWTKESADWQEAAARWRDQYHAAMGISTPNAERKEQPPPASDEEIDVQKIMSEQWSQSHKPYICYRKGKERGLALGRSQVLAAIQKAANGVTLDIPLN